MAMATGLVICGSGMAQVAGQRDPQEDTEHGRRGDNGTGQRTERIGGYVEIDEVDLGGLNDECVYPKAKPTT
jgi:hypothetical protein